MLQYNVKVNANVKGTSLMLLPMIMMMPMPMMVNMPLLQPSSWMVTHTKLALGLPLAASLGGAGGLLGLGLCCLAASLWRRRRGGK